MVDPKVRNLTIFIFPRLAVILLAGWGLKALLGNAKWSGYLARNPLINTVSVVLLLVAVWRGCLSLIRRLVIPAKKPRSYGKWAIVTGSTAGIGEEFASHLFLKEGMSVLLISRTEDKLKKQAGDLQSKNKSLPPSSGLGAAQAEVKYLVYDFANRDPTIRSAFYAKLKSECETMSKDGGLGLLVNNVGTANEVPKSLDELTDFECDDMLHCNVHSTVFMTRAVLPFMKTQRSGAVLSVSSGSGNHPGPFISLYSSTKAFMTQFTRSLHVEWWDSGVDFLVVTPFYIVSNLYKRKAGTVLAPMPSALVRGALAQLGKKYVWQGHGYWFHGLLGNLASYYPETTRRWRKMMVDNRKRYDERSKSK